MTEFGHWPLTHCHNPNLSIEKWSEVLETHPLKVNAFSFFITKLLSPSSNTIIWLLSQIYIETLLLLIVSLETPLMAGSSTHPSDPVRLTHAFNHVLQKFRLHDNH